MSEQLISPKKYELVEDDFIESSNRKLFRIRALIDFGRAKIGELGGYIEKEENLSQLGYAWVSDSAQVFDNACVSDNAWVLDSAQVYGDAQVFGIASISGNAQVYGTAEVYEDAKVSDSAQVFGDAVVFECAKISGNAIVSGEIWLSGDTHLSGSAMVSSHRDFVTFGGDDLRTLVTVCRTQTGIELTHKGFCGTPESFLELITQQYGDSRTTQQYRVGIEYALNRLQDDDSLKEVAT
ncbi:polymer-forming cytoskeletal protein [Mycoavidus sp. SF9855]|uniref:polymer-forming cytoskeletal protein n=1 Tax=Mycoavidus sp. SF9855 TaxID=2968475 RepID=UPI00211BD0DB|nr:polymer-forming cytoskeletal protein [Mycoavidus sp. SF9855]UUM20850.1 polymer-forming cytoskeletal protein [Mycoavidus sp. SF9855]